MDQFGTKFFGEFGVELDYLDSPINFILNGLTRAVHAGAQFKVLKVVVAALAVLVMHCLMFVQFSAKVLFHHISMLKNVIALAFFGTWKGQPYIAFFVGMLGVMTRGQSFLSPLVLRLQPALFAAILLIAVNPKILGVPRAVGNFAAIQARKLIAFVGISSSAGISAGDRTVQRITPELLSVRLEVGSHHNKRLAAFSASEVYGNAIGGILFAMQVIATTFDAAILATLFCFALVAKKLLATAHTVQFDLHGYSPFAWQQEKPMRAVLECQAHPA